MIRMLTRSKPGRAALGAAGDNVVVSALGRPAAVARRAALVSQRLQREPAPVPKKIGNEVVGKGFHQILLVGIAGQVAHRRDGHGNVRQQTGPLRLAAPWLRHHPACGERARSGERSGRADPRNADRRSPAGNSADRAPWPRPNALSRWPATGSRHRARHPARASRSRRSSCIAGALRRAVRHAHRRASARAGRIRRAGRASPAGARTGLRPRARRRHPASRVNRCKTSQIIASVRSRSAASHS